jgi:hypothetical protein
MKQYKWLSKKLISGALVIVMLAVTASVGLGTGPLVAASNPPPDTEWDTTFGGSESDAVYSVQQTTDGGYVIAGVTYSYGAGEADFYLVKTDASGNVAWERTFGDTGNDWARSVQQTADGGYIVAGTTRAYGTVNADFYLVKADASGNMTWEQTYGGSGSDNAFSVQQTADGGYIVLGETRSYGAGGYDFYLMKTDALGNMEWQQTFGGSDDDWAKSVQQTADGGYIMTGYTQSYATVNADLYLVKADASGNMTWEQTFSANDDNLGYSVQQTTDGGYIIGGQTANCSVDWYGVYLVKTDDAGNMEWDSTFAGDDYDEAYSVQQTADGGYIIAGVTWSYGAGEGDFYLIKTDASGNMEWQKTIGGLNDEYAESVWQTTDGGYIVAGDTWSFGAGGEDAYLAKVSPWINTPVGSNVTVSLESGTVTFPDVQESGTTTMTTSTENPVDPTPSDFYVIEGSFIEITTTANYSGLITVGVSYDESQVGDEGSLRLFHWNGAEWEDATTSVDTVENILYGQVTSLSPFFIGEPTVSPVAIAGGPYLVQAGYSIDLDGSASYHPDGTIESYDWSFGDNTTGTGVLVPHTYTEVGIYDVDLTVTDSRGVQSSDTTLVVVYDPEAGSATGGGWFWSGQGNLKNDPESEGKATFGFVVKYKHDVADGNLEFQYHVGDINLKSGDITWLVVSSASANFQGEGTINGEGLYTFRVLAMDGAQAGGQPDEFNIMIWQGTDTEADPIYKALHAELGGGNIIIHDK